jgi:hypothetical protein
MYFMVIGSILRPFEIFYDPLVYFVAIWYIFSRVGVLYQKIWQPWSQPPPQKKREKKKEIAHVFGEYSPSMI